MALVPNGSGMIQRVLIAGTAVTGWFGLFLQFPISIATLRAAGMTMIGAIVTYFSLFTKDLGAPSQARPGQHSADIADFSVTD